MKANEFVKVEGIDKAKYALKNNPELMNIQFFKDLKRLIESWELVQSVGGLEIAKKITFQKRLRNEKATHFVKNPENKKLIKLISRNQKKPESSIKFMEFEQAIADVESCQ